jgi:DNA modification methylase
VSQDKQLFEVEVQPPTPEEIERQRVREEYRAKLAEKLKDPEFRKIEGFPIGTDEAILALSDPPYYTACPNPFIEEWLKEHGKPFDPDTDDYHREPFAADVSEGKNHPIYNAHSYHTKVPHRAIMRYILHYTEPGDVVYDGFCGTGMTGVAAQLCGDRDEVMALGYRVADDGFIWENEPWEAKQALEAGRTNPHPHLLEPKPFSKLGARKVILNDLSPAATFISHNYNSPIDTSAFEAIAKRILSKIGDDCDWMYTTLHRPNGKYSDVEWSSYVNKCAEELLKCRTGDDVKVFLAGIGSAHLGKINYVVWSDVFVCPSCSGDVVFWNAAVDTVSVKMLDEFLCPTCSASLTKKKCTRKKTSRYDGAIFETVLQAVQVPVLVNYSVGRHRFEGPPSAFDVALMAIIEHQEIPPIFPTFPMPVGVNTAQPVTSHGLTHIHHFYTRRNALVFSNLFGHSGKYKRIEWLGTSSLIRTSKLYKFTLDRKMGTVSGTLYVPSLWTENSALKLLKDKAKAVNISVGKFGQSVTQTASASAQLFEESSVDYIFTDPPFGGNLNYSELSFLWEAWLRVLTNNKEEAITNAVQKKGLVEYQSLMTECFRRCFELLKPGRWMTVEFHNSANSVWNSIQEALERVGFIVADVRVLDKGQYSFKQVTTTGATKKDLVVSCYKPTSQFVEQFEKDKGTPKGVREFIEQHLEMLPVAPTTSTGSLESLAERTLGVLFDRMIAYHLVRGARIPLSASEFRVLLDDLCYERDSMYFLPGQVVRYDALKSRGIEVEQLSIFVRDEKSAVQWVRNALDQSPQTLGELTPKFMQASQDWGTHEVMPELKDLLHQYFIREDDENWVVPDPDNEKHLEEVRRNAMLREFQEYVRRTGQLKLFRTEAVLAGFLHCWETNQYDVIVGVCEKIAPKIFQEIQDLVMYYDIAKEHAPQKISQFEFKWEVL